MGMSEGTVARWHVEVGDDVTQWQVIADIEIEKTEVELLAPDSGTVVEILVGENGLAVVQQVLARLQPGPS